MNIYKNHCKFFFEHNSFYFMFKFRNDYKDYSLESRLQFRINAAMQTVKRMN